MYDSKIFKKIEKKFNEKFGKWFVWYIVHGFVRNERLPCDVFWRTFYRNLLILNMSVEDIYHNYTFIWIVSCDQKMLTRFEKIQQDQKMIQHQMILLVPRERACSSKFLGNLEKVRLLHFLSSFICVLYHSCFKKRIVRRFEQRVTQIKCSENTVC